MRYHREVCLPHPLLAGASLSDVVVSYKSRTYFENLYIRKVFPRAPIITRSELTLSLDTRVRKSSEADSRLTKANTCIWKTSSRSLLTICLDTTPWRHSPNILLSFCITLIWLINQVMARERGLRTPLLIIKETGAAVEVCQKVPPRHRDGSSHHTRYVLIRLYHDVV